MRSSSLVLSLAVILLMLVTMSSFAIAACSAPAYYSAPACACSAPAYYSAPACSCSAPACSAEKRHTCDCNCIYRQPTQAEPKMAQVTPVGIWEGKSEYKGFFDVTGMTNKDVAVWVEEKMLVVEAGKQGEEKKKWTIALPENIKKEKIEEKIEAEVKDGLLHLTIAKAERLKINVK